MSETKPDFEFFAASRPCTVNATANDDEHKITTDMIQNVFADRRRRFVQQMVPGAAVFFASRESHRNSDTEYPFRQNSDFIYLTGFDEPDTIAVLLKEDAADATGKFILFVRPKEFEAETWAGIRAGVEGAKTVFGADEAYELKEADDTICRLLENREALYYGFHSGPDKRVIGWISRLRRSGNRMGFSAPGTLRDPRDILHSMRLIKTPAEIDILRRAGAITREAHKECMRVCRPGINERQLAGVLAFVYRKHGSDRDAFNAIVARGANACVLHYSANNCEVGPDDLVLIDSGAELDYYSADITTTFPASGKFNDVQAQVYNAVLAAHRAALAVCKPGQTIEAVHEAARDVLIDALIDWGLVTDTREEQVAKEKEVIESMRAERKWKTIKPEDVPFKAFFPHGTCHWLGLDVHDVGVYRTAQGSRKLEPGMAITVEPGLYFRPGTKSLPVLLQGIGVRIEDDVLITPEGHEILTHGTPRTIEEIEATMAEPSQLPL